MTVAKTREEEHVSIRRLAKAFDCPISTVGRWVREKPDEVPLKLSRRCPVSGNPSLREKVKQLCHEPRHGMFGHRRIKALLRRLYGIHVNRKTVLRIMREQGLTRPKVWHRPSRPKRVEKMNPTAPDQAWQIDMTSFQLSDMTPLFLIAVTDCCTRQILGWTLDRRCRASEWVSAVRMALESRGRTTKTQCEGILLRTDNGAQPCSRKFVQYLSSVGVKGQYTGYNAPDDNAYIERLFRTIKEEEVWPNLYDSFSEAHQAIDDYINYYNQDRIHSALGYQTPNEIEEVYRTLKAA